VGEGEFARGGAVKIAIDSLCKSYGTTRVVEGLHLEIGDGEFFTLLGASGSGKTTTLRMIAGLERPDAGRILFGDQVVNDAGEGRFIPPEARGAGMVFQSYALWPHLSVFDNLALGLKYRKLHREKIQQKVREALMLVGLSGLEKRYPDQLSGGQQQRVALSRALVQEPRILLFDEPLSNLDAKLREQMRKEIRSLQQRLGITAVYVTHDQAEAMAISDRIGVMESGALLQVAAPDVLYRRPKSASLARFLGLANLFEGTANGKSVRVGDATFVIDDLLPPGPVTLLVRPEQVCFGSGTNAVETHLVSRTFLGNLVEYELQAPTLRTSLRVQRLAGGGDPGMSPTVWFPSDSLIALPASRPLGGTAGATNEAQAELAIEADAFGVRSAMRP
jgi:iron(III) transport system ATP-binding protein